MFFYIFTQGVFYTTETLRAMEGSLEPYALPTLRRLQSLDAHSPHHIVWSNNPGTLRGELPVTIWFLMTEGKSSDFFFRVGEKYIVLLPYKVKRTRKPPKIPRVPADPPPLVVRGLTVNLADNTVSCVHAPGVVETPHLFVVDGTPCFLGRATRHFAGSYRSVAAITPAGRKVRVQWTNQSAIEVADTVRQVRSDKMDFYIQFQTTHAAEYEALMRVIKL